MAAVIKLSDEFIQEMKKKEPVWGSLGWVTYKRTYARYLENEGRTENWDETIRRVVEGNVNLEPRLQEPNPSKQVIKQLETEAEKMFEVFYKLMATPPGRGLWQSGTEYSTRTGDSLNNCWFVAVKPQPYFDSKIKPFYLDSKVYDKVSFPFTFLFDQSMKGGGVGFSVTRKNVKQIPEVYRRVKLSITCDPLKKDVENLNVDPSPERKPDVYFKVPDSREGWAESLALVIDAHFDQIFDPDYYIKADELSVVIDVSDVRAAGERIKGFGGVASGANPLIDFLRDVNELLNERVNNKLTSVDCVDIMNLIGRTVVAGNVRRTAEIALGDPDDQAFVIMKQDKEKLYSHRWASNNSVLIDTKFDNYGEIAEAIAVNGEPGIGNIELAKNYGRIIDGFNPQADPDAEGWNPCAEITLANGEPCNLVEVFPLIVEREGWDVQEVLQIVTRYAKRVTFSKYDWAVSRSVIEKNRRIGVSLSGLQDWILSSFGKGAVIGWNGQEPIYNKDLVVALNNMFNAVTFADKKYSIELGVNESIKKTTIKPSGTVALLPGVSPGMHFHYAAYFIRRIRFQHNDPLLDVLKQCGYHMEPDVYSQNTVVVEFPTKAPTADHPEFKSAGDVSIEEQFAFQALLQTYWADNSVSCTITFKEEEKGKIEGLLHQYRSIIKSTSLLPYSGHGYKQAPIEPITKEQYGEMVVKVKAKPQELAQTDQAKDLELVGSQDCAGGACPIR